MKQALRVSTALIALGLLVLVVACDDSSTASRSSPSPSTRAESAATAEDALGGGIGETVEAWVAAQRFVKKELVAPSTAEFNGVARSPFVVYLGDARYRVTASVDSQSSYGAMIRTEFVAIVRAKRDDAQTWVLESLEF